MERIYVARERRFSVRFHHLLADDERDLHDHPWDFASLILVGAYRETTPEGVHEYEAPTLIRHRAEDLHRLELLSPDAWTLVTTGPIRRHWGFLTPEGWLPWETYGEQRTEISPAR